jgi:predicted nicotinamide N-methyase
MIHCKSIYSCCLNKTKQKMSIKSILIFTCTIIPLLNITRIRKLKKNDSNNNKIDLLPPLQQMMVKLTDQHQITLLRLLNATDGMFSKTKKQCDLWEFVWGTSALLARILCELDLTGKRIIEIGSGLGLASITVAKFTNPLSVVTTDLVVDALKIVELTARENSCNDKIIINKLDFNSIDLPSPNFNHAFDLVMGSDVLFMNWCAKPMARTSIALAAKPNGVILIADPFRLNDEDFLQELMVEFNQSCIYEFPDSMIQQYVNVNLVEGSEKSVVKVKKAKLLLVWNENNIISTNNKTNNLLVQSIISVCEKLGLEQEKN